MSGIEIEVGDFWKTKDLGIECVVTKIEMEDGVKWVESYSEIDGEHDSDTYANFLRDYEFVRAAEPVAPSSQITARDILIQGANIMDERGKQYDNEGKQERSMRAIVASFNAKTGRDLTELEGWLFMTDMKAVRALNGGSLDCFIDGAAYFALAGESVADDL